MLLMRRTSRRMASASSIVREVVPWTRPHAGDVPRTRLDPNKIVSECLKRGLRALISGLPDVSVGNELREELGSFIGPGSMGGTLPGRGCCRKMAGRCVSGSAPRALAPDANAGCRCSSARAWWCDHGRQLSEVGAEADRSKTNQGRPGGPPEAGCDDRQAGGGEEEIASNAYAGSLNPMISVSSILAAMSDVRPGRFYGVDSSPPRSGSGTRRPYMISFGTWPAPPMWKARSRSFRALRTNSIAAFPSEPFDLSPTGVEVSAPAR